jgi:glycosyltransferase 2 family protein
LTEPPNASLRRARRIATSFPVRLLVTAGLLVAIGLSIDWGQVADRLADGSWGWFAAGVGVLVVALAIGAVRWHVLLRGARLEVSAWQSARAYAIGLFANNFLPTSFGGDAARALLVARGGPALARSLTSVLVDRASAIGCLLLVGLAGLAVSPGSVPGDLALTLGAVCGLAAVAVLVAVLALRARRLRRLLPERLRPWAREVRATLLAYGADRRLLVEVLALGVAYQALAVASAWMLARALELDLDFALLAVILPLVLVATLFPVSIAGFGVREAGFVVLLGTAGVSAADATLLSLLTVVAIALASSPGAIALLTSGRPRTASVSPLRAEP